MATDNERTFMMGKFPAVLPGSLRYACTNHMWCKPVDGRMRFGFTTYAVRLMQDVYFLDWVVSPGHTVRHLQQIGHIETSKAVADLFAPVEGKITVFNPDLLKDPSGINVEPYGKGWLFDIESADGITVGVDEYYAFLDANWEKTQRMLKGHM